MQLSETGIFCTFDTQLNNSCGPIPCSYLKQINVQETFEMS